MDGGGVMATGREPKVGARNRVRKSERAQAAGSPWQGANQTSTRCRAMHDVPYTLRCVLDASHVHQVVRDAIVTSGEYAGARVVVYEPHQDKSGRTW